MHYEGKQGYSPASIHFADLYSEIIKRDTSLAETAKPGDAYEYDGTTKCTVLRPVLNLLYSGNNDKAWSELTRLYNFPDRDQLQKEIESVIIQSPLYVPPK